MSFYLVDYENLKNIKGCDSLREEDTIVFFYTANADKLSFDLHMQLSRCAARKEYFGVECGGKNALDFQLSTYIGSLLFEHPNEKIYIMTNDNGYKHVIAFWQKRGVTGRLAIINNVQQAEKNKGGIAEAQPKEAPTADANGTAEVKPTVTEPKANSVTEEKAKAAPDTVFSTLTARAASFELTEAQCREIERIVDNYKTKQAINNNVMKLIKDSGKVGKILKAINPFLQNKK